MSPFDVICLEMYQLSDTYCTLPTHLGKEVMTPLSFVSLQKL